MTRAEILALEGRELDAAVAEHVMGWYRYTRDEILAATGADAVRWFGDAPEPETFLLEEKPTRIYPDDRTRFPGKWVIDVYSPPRYSSDIAAAWQVVERMRGRGYSFSLEEYVGDEWGAAFVNNSGRLVEERHRSVSAAICRAALLALCGEGEA